MSNAVVRTVLLWRMAFPCSAWAHLCVGQFTMSFFGPFSQNTRGAGCMIQVMWNLPTVALGERKESKGPPYQPMSGTTSVGLVGNTESYPGWHYPLCTHRGWDRNFGVVNQSREDLWGTAKARGWERRTNMPWDGNWVGALISVGAEFGCVGGFFFYICSEHASTQL